MKIFDISGLIKVKKIKDILYFIIITLGFHYFFRYWAAHWDYWPIKKYIEEIYQFLTITVFEQSTTIISFLLGNKVSVSGQQMIFSNHGFIGIGSGCSGLKQMMQFAVLFLLIKGSIVKKIWYIPLGVIVMHITNLFRIVCLSIIVSKWPEYWHFSHNYLFRPIFYMLIFWFWVLWIEKIKK